MLACRQAGGGLVVVWHAVGRPEGLQLARFVLVVRAIALWIFPAPWLLVLF